MLTGMITATVLVTAPLLLLGIFRTRWQWALGIFGLVFGIGLAKDVLVFQDLWSLLGYTQMDRHLALIACWVIFSTSLGYSNRAKELRHPLITAALLGALIGEWGAALCLLQRCSDPKQRVRLMCAVLAGGVLSPMGDLGWLLTERSNWLYMLPLSGIAALFAVGQSIDVDPPENGSYVPYAIGLVAVLGQCLMADQLIVMASAAVASVLWLLSQRERIDLRLPLTVAAGILAINVSISTGSAEFMAWGLEEAQYIHTTYLHEQLAIGSLLISCFVGEMYSAAFLFGFLDRDLDLQLVGVSWVMAAGVSVGGVAPLLLGRCLSDGWPRAVAIAVLSYGYIVLATHYFPLV